MEKILSPGRRFWHIVAVEGIEPYAVGPKVVTGVLKFLPAGEFEHNGHVVKRAKSLIQIHTDPGGRQTIAAADIRLKDPGRARK